MLCVAEGVDTCVAEGVDVCVPEGVDVCVAEGPDVCVTEGLDSPASSSLFDLLFEITPIQAPFSPIYCYYYIVMNNAYNQPLKKTCCTQKLCVAKHTGLSYSGAV